MRRVLSLLIAVVLALPALAAQLHLPGTVTQEATGPSGAAVHFSATADGASGEGEDHNGRPNGGGPVAVTCSPASGSTFAVGTTTVNCSAADGSTGSFEVIVNDTTAPSLTLGGNLTVNATSADGAVVAGFTASAHDLVDGALAVSCSPGPGLFPVGTTLVTCSAADAHGNQTAGSFRVTVLAPALPPELTVPADITAEATGADGAVVTFSVSARAGGGGDGDDDHNGRPDSGPISTSCAPASGSTFALGTTSVTCTATDGGGTTTDSFNVTVVDTTAPRLDLPRDFTVQASSNDGATVSFTATATDLVDGVVSVDCSPASGSTFAIGTTDVSCSAADARGNSATAGFTVTITAPDEPPPPPELNLPDDITVQADGPDGAIVTFIVTVSGTGTGDEENGRPTTDGVICAPPSGSLFPIGTTTVQCSAGDVSGTFLVHVIEAPDRTVVVTASPDMLWPPDHKMVPVTITVTISDGSSFTAQIVAVASSENDPDDHTTPDWVITGPLTVDLRAEKSAKAKARSYAIDVEVIDDAGTHYLERAIVMVTNGTSSASRLRSPRGRG